MLISSGGCTPAPVFISANQPPSTSVLALP
jgi:hypothetical protein